MLNLSAGGNPRIKRRHLLTGLGLGLGSGLTRIAAAKPRLTLNLFSPSDRFGPALQKIAPQFEEETGIGLRVTLMGYPELYQRAVADFVGKTGQGDVYAVDIVWSGEWGSRRYLVDLGERIQQDRDRLQSADILPIMWKLGEWQGKQFAFPLSGYAGLLNFNRQLLQDPPTTLAALAQTAARLTGQGRYGIALNGARGAPVAQDWMYYMLAHGGSLLDPTGKPVVNQDRNVAALRYFQTLFRYAPPGAITYAWVDREMAFNAGKAAMQISWSTGLRDKLDPAKSTFPTQLGLAPIPLAEGIPVRSPFGGWGLGINRDCRYPDAAWQLIRWLSTPARRKQFVRIGCEPIHRQTLTDPDLLQEFPYFRQVLPALEQGDGDFRPRVPQYARLQDALGVAINGVITGQMEAKTALDQVQRQVDPLFE